MILVDTSAWIELLGASGHPAEVLARHTRLRTERYRTLRPVPLR